MVWITKDQGIGLIEGKFELDTNRNTQDIGVILRKSRMAGTVKKKMNKIIQNRFLHGY